VLRPLGPANAQADHLRTNVAKDDPGPAACPSPFSRLRHWRQGGRGNSAHLRRKLEAELIELGAPKSGPNYLEGARWSAKGGLALSLSAPPLPALACAPTHTRFERKNRAWTITPGMTAPQGGRRDPPTDFERGFNPRHQGRSATSSCSKPAPWARPATKAGCAVRAREYGGKGRGDVMEFLFNVLTAIRPR